MPPATTSTSALPPPPQIGRMRRTRSPPQEGPSATVPLPPAFLQPPVASSSSSSLAAIPDTERMAVGAGDASLFSPSQLAAGRTRGRTTQDASTCPDNRADAGVNADGEAAPSEEAVLEAAFNYRVVCEDGAYVRVGLELSSRHIYTIGSQSVVEVTERCVNNQGLARLRTADGWISEMLNPLSGQRGPIVELVPLRRPLKFRVVYPSGALVRSGVELSSSVVGSIPQGEVIVVNEKRYSNTPSYRCVPRLRLADGSGWISVRINSPPPEDHPVVQLLGFAEEADLRAFAAAMLDPPMLLPPMADGAGAVEMEEGDGGSGGAGGYSDEGDSYDDYSDDDDEDEDGSYLDESGSEEDGEGEGDGVDSSSELVLTGEESQDASLAGSQAADSEAGSPPQAHRRRRRRRIEELSSSLGSNGGGGSGGGGGRGGTVMRDGRGGGRSVRREQQRQVPVVHFNRLPPAAAGLQQGGKSGEGKAGGAARGAGQAKPRWPQQTQQHEPHADNAKIVRALGLPGAGKDLSAHDDSCLVCFSSARTATFVHGETGHISCCLECARVLKGRGDPCPVCRLPIDRVIQHFWT